MITEDQLEQLAIQWFQDTGWNYVHGAVIAPEGVAAEREDFRAVVLKGRLAEAVRRLNPKLPESAVEEVVHVVTKPEHPSLVQNNRAFHRYLMDGVLVEFTNVKGEKEADYAQLVDFTWASRNDFLVVNQFTITGTKKPRRPDLVCFVNGLPLGLIELKNPADQQADVWKAFDQLQTYQAEISDLLVFNEALVVSDGMNARVGSLTASKEWFMPWRTISNENDKPQVEFELEKVVRGFFRPDLFLDYVRYFILFEQDGDGLIKKIAGYHQFHGVREAVRVTLIASATEDFSKVKEDRATYGKEVVPGSKKAGVFWHTQGSGKSISMCCYAGKLLQQPEMNNPTLVVVTDRNDLDGQLYQQFCSAKDLLKQTPEQAESREQLREMLASRKSGGIIFTTIQKFSLEGAEDDHPVLCERTNVVVISDEAHRSQYGTKGRLDTKTGKYVYGYAKHMRDALPGASFIGFTGTPIEKADANTQETFGGYVSIYDIEDAKEDKATVPIYYESRLAKLDINREEIDRLNKDVEEVIEDEEDVSARESTKGKWAELAKLVGAKERVEEIAADLVEHYETRTSVLEGKAMVVAMSRDICVSLFDEIIKLRPEWAGTKLTKDGKDIGWNHEDGAIRIVMTGTASDRPGLQDHVYSKGQKKRLAKRFKDAKDPLKLVIVRDMWLTGFDAPCCHTMYVDKPMAGHNLMQAIARVNRVFAGKEGGLVVDYIGIAAELKNALKTYTDAKGKGTPTLKAEKALEVLLEKLDVLRGLFHGFDYSKFEGTPAEVLALLPAAANHILGLGDKNEINGKKRFLDAMAAANVAYSLCSTLDGAKELKNAGVAGSLSGKPISHVLEDKSGAVWVGSFEAGLTRFDRDGQWLETFRHGKQQADSLSNDDVRAILEDRAGRLWVGTVDGLELLDRSNGKFTHFRREDSSTDSLRDSYIMSLYEDDAGLVWIGTRTGGVSRWNPRSWEFGGHRPKWLGSGPVTAFADARDSRVWIASLDGGLVQFDTNTSEMTPLALGDERVMSLRQDHLGTLWVGTMAGGLMKITADGRIETIPVKVGDPRATSSAAIATIVEARSGQIWIGTFGGGVNVLDPATGLIRQLPFGADQAGAISDAEVTSIAEDRHGNFWIGTMRGLNFATADGRVLKVFQNDPNDAQSLPANTVYAITIDARERVWIATEGGGLAQVVGTSDAIRFKTITRAEGLTSDTLYGIVADGAGDLWLSGNAGLMRFNPGSQAIKAYHREHGLQGEEFAFGASYRMRDGRVCFGGPGGFNIFDPARLTENRQSPRLALTNVDVLGARMQSATPFWLLQSIPLSYRDSIVSLDFGVFDFGSLKHNRLAYRMPGLTDEWIELGNQRRITLTTLPAGKHVLEVRAASSDSVWSPQPLQVTIQRDPAPWRSRWAYATYAAIVLSLLLLRARRQRRKFQEVLEQRAHLESEVQLRTRELVESNRQLAEAAQAKSNFLDRMSHELRTPMNGVVGMTELLSRTALSATQSHLTKTIRSSAQILLQIVNDLLDLSKIRAGKVALERLPIDLGQVLEECTSLFAGAAENKGIELIVCPPTHAEKVLLGDPLRVRQIVMNLVGNAVKFTSQGEVVVRADVQVIAPDRAVAKISVTDTGIGMDAAAVKRIFEPFSQADETTTRKFGGTGLGLAICRELSDIMGGEIAVESAPQIGSTFHLSLPLAVAETAVPVEAAFPQRKVRILTRRVSLRESLSRHAASLGLVITDESASSSDDIVVLDVGTHSEQLKLLLAQRSAWPGLIAVAAPAEVESNDLRVVLDEKMIVLKPVHRIALREALAVAAGVQVATTESSKPAVDKSSNLKGHVLLVEDEPVNAAVAEGYLAALGCTSVWVKSGADAVARSAAEHFDLVLMDLNMPDMDGFSATRLIRQREGKGVRTAIVALTAHDAVAYRDKCLRADMDDIITKPYTLEDCARLLKKWLAHEQDASAQVVKLPVSGGKHDLASVDAAAVASLRKLRGGTNADLYTKLVELFRIGSADSLAQLNAAMTSNDLAAAAGSCHKLASSAANVGALAYGKELRRLEQLCIAGEHSQAQELNRAIQAAYPALMDALLGLTMRASA